MLLLRRFTGQTFFTETQSTSYQGFKHAGSVIATELVTSFPALANYACFECLSRLKRIHGKLRKAKSAENLAVLKRYAE